MGLRIGDDGQAITVMTPGGYVSVGGKRYQARAQVGFVEPGQRIIVLGGDNHGLIVCVAEQGRTYTKIPGFGRLCFDSFGERKQDQANREEAARQRWLLQRRRYLRRVGLGIGALATGLGLFLARSELFPRLEGYAWVMALAACITAGALLGMVLIGAIERYLQSFDERFYRLSIPTTSLGALGGVTLALWTIPAYGIAFGLLIVFALGFLLLLPVPLLALVVSSSGAEGGPGDRAETGMAEAGGEDF